MILTTNYGLSKFETTDTIDLAVLGNNFDILDNELKTVSDNIINSSERTKVGFITITQAVDLDTLETSVNENTTNITNITNGTTMVGSASKVTGYEIQMDGVGGVGIINFKTL